MAKKKSDNASWLRPLPEDFAGDSMSPKRRMIFTGITFMVLIGFSVLIWSSYTAEENETGPVPVVRADNSEIKKKPEDPGGDEIPFQDREVFAVVDNLPVEDESVIAASAEIPIARPVAEEPVEEVAEETVAVVESEAERAENITPAAPPPPPPAVTSAASSGNFMIQIGAFSSRASAENAWATLAKDHGSIVGELNPDYARSNSLFLVRGGRLATRQAADDVCTALKQKNQGCFVVVAE